MNQTLHDLGRLGESPDGMDRVAYSPEDIAGREFTLKLMQEAGLETRIDTAGNIIGRRAGSDGSLPAIAMGSHTDTVPKGGKYDGALGVMAAIEVVHTLEEQGHRTRHPVEVIDFTNEEGTRFHRWLVGSRSMAGLLEQEDLDAVDDDGQGLGPCLADIGGDISRIGEAVRGPGELAAYFELHIEQGPNLYRSGTPIGVVTGITGRAVFEVEIEGKANHAGTTPMSMRRDALVSASKLVLAIQKMAAEQEICRVSTVGSIKAIPNAVNVIPGSASIGLEFRDTDMEALAAAEQELRRITNQAAVNDEVDIEVQRHRFTTAVPITPEMQALVSEAAENCGMAWEPLPSGAGHDAQAIASIAPVAMIFVPSVDGISHSSEEYSTPEDCANGAQVLLELLLLADDRF
ncbi:MAG: M20 family metallo-hydrolase [Chloroflexi bacterium]|nr:M20 family metallo-hydrolase [Chloroflexota bacterium]MCI0812140.1 M20 family metallo-hydrolase [Chloroflexota bacterium]MCI0830761.1 M20 family metallo-hydrolase [Chloroflexota bacterium]MCI0863754.1 M20 family metallo-hydrolase [Chloroflexota bacterium]MCI0900005.1 M20 family metallo-hydrolase [Chloroflexota bacterium]